MKIKYTVLGPFMTNTYIVYNEKTMEGLVVDPSFTRNTTSMPSCRIRSS